MEIVKTDGWRSVSSLVIMFWVISIWVLITEDEKLGLLLGILPYVRVVSIELEVPFRIVLDGGIYLIKGYTGNHGWVFVGKLTEIA